MMPLPIRRFQLSRRAVLKGSGSIAIALPWLELMSPRRTAAAVPAARRFLAVYQPGGTVLEKWTPTGTETAFTLSPILTPFEPVKSKILIMSGLDMQSAVGEQRQAGLIAWLTGTAQGPSNGTVLWAKGPSIDQVIAGSPVGAGKRFASLSMAIRWGTGRAKGLVSPFDIANYAGPNPVTPIAPALDPMKIWQSLFGTPGPTAGGAKWNKSILDSVAQRYAKLAARLGAADKQRMEQHLTRIRELEASLTATTATCTAPTLVDTSDYNPTTGLNSSDNGAVKDLVTDGAIPKVGKLMTDMMVMAMACDMTAVGTLQWSDTEAKHTFPWLNLTETHAFYQNDGGYKPVELEKICTWYSSQHTYLLQQMARVDMGGHTLLDESVVFFGSERQHAATYAKTNMPFILAGGGGGLRCGRWVKYNGRSHNDLLVSLLNLFGDPRTTFGDPMYCTGALSGLT